MPFCPDCHEEYDAGVDACADCGSALVAELSGGDELPTEVPIAVRDGEVAERLIALLVENGIEVLGAGEDVEWQGASYPSVRVPAGAAQATALLVARHASFHMTEQDEWGRGVIDFYEAEGGTIESHPLLKRAPKEVVAMGPAVFPELEALALDGVRDVSRWACRRLVDFGTDASDTLGTLCARAVRGAKRNAVFGVLGALDDAANFGQAPVVRLPASVADDLGDDEPAVRALAALAIGRLGDASSVEALAPLLLDDEPLVVEEVVEALDSLTGVDLDLAGDADPTARGAAADRMREWARAHGSSGRT